MRNVLALALLLTPTAAEAGPAVRFGLTFALVDEGAPGQHELGPFIGLGARLGPALVEADYAYLSFMEPDTGPGGMHRVGVNLRADLYRNTERPCLPRIACTRALGVYAEIGGAMRYGQWHLDAHTISPRTDRQREAHVGIGIELDNTLVPTRHGWQLGLRFAVAPRDDIDFACRGTSCDLREPDRAYDRAVLVEWSFLIGR